MKHKILLVIFLITVTIQSYSQSIKGVLIQSFLTGRADDGNKDLSESDSKPFIYSYVYSNKKSLQKLMSENKSKIDTVYLEKNGEKLVTTSEIINPSSRCYYKDYDSDVYKFTSTTNDEDLSIKETIIKYKWVLHNETKTINGFKCKKATTTNTYTGNNFPVTVWYCEEININDGPFDYSGLPGFIIEVYLGEYTKLSFEKLVFNNNNYTIEEPKNTALDINFEGYRRILSNKRY
jgi:GLPGLI family protein